MRVHRWLAGLPALVMLAFMPAAASAAHPPTVTVASGSQGWVWSQTLSPPDCA